MKCMGKKVMVITGASSGVGEALTAHFTAHEYTVCATARNREKLRALEEGNNGDLHTYSCDIRNLDDVKSTFAKIHEDHGHIDVLINRRSKPSIGSSTPTSRGPCTAPI
jgi:NADP-dependent 3-hydroxy acid dehydrogenase YdfG